MFLVKTINIIFARSSSSVSPFRAEIRAKSGFFYQLTYSSNFEITVQGQKFSCRIEFLRRIRKSSKLWHGVQEILLSRRKERKSSRISPHLSPTITINFFLLPLRLSAWNDRSKNRKTESLISPIKPFSSPLWQKVNWIENELKEIGRIKNNRKQCGASRRLKPTDTKNSHQFNLFS